MLLELSQHRCGFEIDHGKTCTFPSQTGSPVSTFRDMHLHLLIQKRFLYSYWHVFQGLRNNDQSFKFTIQLRNLVTIEKQEH